MPSTPTIKSANGSLPLASSGARAFCEALQMLSGQDFPLPAFGAPVAIGADYVKTAKLCQSLGFAEAYNINAWRSSSPDDAYGKTVGFYLAGFASQKVSLSEAMAFDSRHKSYFDEKAWTKIACM